MVSELNIFVGKWSKIAALKKSFFFFFADVALFCLEELVWSPSYYTCGALRTGGGCRASIAPAWIHRVDARTRVCVDAWTRGCVNRPIFFLLLDKSRKLSKIVSVLQSASVERFDVSRMRDFLVYFSICEPAPIWICSVSVSDIDYHSQNLYLSLNISQIQINEN